MHETQHGPVAAAPAAPEADHPKREKFQVFRVSPEEKADIVAIATHRGLDASNWFRAIVLREKGAMHEAKVKERLLAKRAARADGSTLPDSG